MEENENENNNLNNLRNSKKFLHIKNGRINGMYNWRLGWRYSIIKQRNNEVIRKPNLNNNNNNNNNENEMTLNNNYNYNNYPLQYELAWKWWNEICGSPKYILAPMIGQSELSFRLLCRYIGNIHLCYTPMYEAKNIINGLHDEEITQVCPLPYIDRPLICQIAGSNTEEMIQACLRIQSYYDGIDINLGCPQRCADVGNYGSFLPERNLDHLLSMLRQLTQIVLIPITVKIRLLSNNLEENVNYVLKLQETGIYAICIHGRTRHDKEYEIPADWNIVRILKSILKIPVISNGSILSYEDAQTCLKYTNVDAVMSGTGLLRNPTLFIPPTKYLHSKSISSSSFDVLNEEDLLISNLYQNKSYILHILILATKYLEIVEYVTRDENSRNKNQENNNNINENDETQLMSQNFVNNCENHLQANIVIATRNHLFSMLQVFLMDTESNFDIWSLLSSNSIQTIKQFQSILDVIYVRMIGDVIEGDVDIEDNNDDIKNNNKNDDDNKIEVEMNRLKNEMKNRKKYNLREIKKSNW